MFYNNHLNCLNLRYVIPYAKKSLYPNIQVKKTYGCWDMITFTPCFGVGGSAVD